MATRSNLYAMRWYGSRVCYAMGCLSPVRHQPRCSTQGDTAPQLQHKPADHSVRRPATDTAPMRENHTQCCHEGDRRGTERCDDRQVVNLATEPARFTTRVGSQQAWVHNERRSQQALLHNKRRTGDGSGQVTRRVAVSVCRPRHSGSGRRSAAPAGARCASKV